jgi:phosphatidylglycerophosphatase A
MLGSIHRIIGIGFGSGLSPFAPGTAGTLLAWGLFVGLMTILPLALLAVLLICGLLYGFWACGQCSQDLMRPDDGAIVWDEIIAFSIVLLFLWPTSYLIQAIAFLIFRFFDVLKPWPIHRLDRYFKTNFHHHAQASRFAIVRQGFGIMVDDLLAALFTILIITLGMHWLS